MPEKRTVAIQTRVAKRLDARVKEIAPRVAERTRPVLGNVNVSKDERRRRWWQVASDWPADPEESRIRELELLGYDPDGLPIPDENGNPVVSKLTREDVGLLKHPYREIDMRAAGNGDDDRLMAKYAQEMTALGPPDPEPLEAAARVAQAGNGTASMPMIETAGPPPAPMPMIEAGGSPAPMPEIGGY